MQKNKEKEFMKYLKKREFKNTYRFQKEKILTMKCLNFKYK